MSPQKLKAHMEGSETLTLLLDVREPWEHRIANISEARLIPMAEIPGALQDLDSSQEIAVFCHLGVRSLHVARFLEHNGFTRVINLSGGIDAWSREVDPGIPRY